VVKYSEVHLEENIRVEESGQWNKFKRKKEKVTGTSKPMKISGYRVSQKEELVER